mmetsp:Transcript_52775/g.125617  ORF Transcript_52775/g.125617 Transcript_52775/m.125617 type:complete len:856 (-) Transcript_52775:650-3217(-)
MFTQVKIRGKGAENKRPTSSVGPFNAIRDLVPSATSSTPLKDLKTRIASDSASVTLMFGGNPVDGAYSLDALCSPGSSSTDYMQHLVAVSPALHVCRVYLSLNDKWNEEVIVLLLNTGQSTIRHVRAALAPQLSTSRFPALRGTGTPPAESRSELLVFLSETGERLRGDDTLPVASESAMRDFGRHSAVIAQLEIPSADENRMQAVLNWDAAQRARFVAKAEKLSDVAHEEKNEEEDEDEDDDDDDDEADADIRLSKRIPTRESRSDQEEREWYLRCNEVAEKGGHSATSDAMSDDEDDEEQAGFLAPEKMLQAIDSNAPISAPEEADVVQEGASYHEWRRTYIERLQTVSRAVPPPATFATLQEFHTAFEGLSTTKSNTPGMAACGVTEVMEEFDSVDPETEALIAQLFSPARAFIQKLADMNLEKHDSEAAIQNFSELNNLLEWHEKIRCSDPSAAEKDDDEVREILEGCKELHPLFTTLLDKYAAAEVFEDSSSQEAFASLPEDFAANETWAKALLAAEEGRAEDEARNLQELRAIAEQSSALHFVAAEQISWARENVALAQRNSSDKLSRLDAELARLQKARAREARASKALKDKAAFLKREAVDERLQAKRLQNKVLHAALKSKIRVQRADEGVQVTKIAVGLVEGLQREVTNEAAELASYAVELKKAVAADVADAYLGAIKFTYIESKAFAKNLESATSAVQAAQQHWSDKRSLSCAEIPSSVEAEKEAKEKMLSAQKSHTTIQEKIQGLNDQAAAMERSFGPLKDFLGSHADSVTSTGMTVCTYRLSAEHLLEWRAAHAEGPGANAPREIENPDSFRRAYTERFEGRAAGVFESAGRLFKSFSTALIF